MRIAAFIDAENIGADHFGALQCWLSQKGQITSMRAVGDFSMPALAPWCELGRAGTVQLDAQAHMGQRKNTADIALAALAMEAALCGTFQAIAIASRDGDFTPLALHIRRRGLDVLGWAPPGGPCSEAFRNACTSFVAMTDSRPKPAAAMPIQAAPEIAMTPRERKTFSDWLHSQCSPPQAEVRLSVVGAALKRDHPALAARFSGKPGRLAKTIEANRLGKLVDGPQGRIEIFLP